MISARHESERIPTRAELLYEALARAKRAIASLLGPSDISRVALPYDLREAFLSTDKAIRTLGLDIEQNKHVLGSARYVRFGAFARDWVTIRSCMGEQVQTSSMQKMLIETFHKRASMLADELLQGQIGHRQTLMQGETAAAPKKRFFSFKMAALVSGSVGALWLVKAFLDRHEKPISLE